MGAGYIVIWDGQLEQKWLGRRVLIIGAARQGLALASYLARHGAKVVLNDLRSESDLADVKGPGLNLPEMRIARR